MRLTSLYTQGVCIVNNLRVENLYRCHQLSYESRLTSSLYGGWHQEKGGKDEKEKGEEEEEEEKDVWCQEGGKDEEKEKKKDRRKKRKEKKSMHVCDSLPSNSS